MSSIDPVVEQKREFGSSRVEFTLSSYPAPVSGRMLTDAHPPEVSRSPTHSPDQRAGSFFFAKRLSVRIFCPPMPGKAI
jgi:hypothetical protein